MLYCRFRSKDRVHALEGSDPCRACDVRAMALINDGKKPEDFPKGCEYSTDNRVAAEAEVAAWKKDEPSREGRYAAFKNFYE